VKNAKIAKGTVFVTGLVGAVNPRVRATSILIEDGQILLVQQDLRASLERRWSLPGGGLELGETLEACAIREVREETGLDVVVDRLLYVCDRLLEDAQVLHITFAMRRVGGRLQIGYEPEPDATPIIDVRMVPIAQLCEYGFTPHFQQLCLEGFPDSGSYKGLVEHIGL
jgi:ADP-ribose pyrophosphatase YjhB (NUDIX family)